MRTLCAESSEAPLFYTLHASEQGAKKRTPLLLLNFFERSNPNDQAFTDSHRAVNGDCRLRFEIWGPIYPVPTVSDERPAVPSEDQVLDDLEDAVGQIRGATVESEVISVDSRIYIVLVEKDSELPVLYKVTYYLLDGEWVWCPRSHRDVKITESTDLGTSINLPTYGV